MAFRSHLIIYILLFLILIGLVDTSQFILYSLQRMLFFAILSSFRSYRMFKEFLVFLETNFESIVSGKMSIALFSVGFDV